MNFISKWPEKDITAHIRKHKVLVLFDKNKDNTADVIVYGKFKDSVKRSIKNKIFTAFGNQSITEQLCEKINEYAEKLYRKYLLEIQKARGQK